MNKRKASRRDFIKGGGTFLGGAAGLLAAANTKSLAADTENSQAAACEQVAEYEFTLATDVSFPPTLPDGRRLVRETSGEFLRPIDALRKGVSIAKVPPTVEFMFYPGQDTRGLRWSNWGCGSFSGGKYYSAIGDHAGLGRPDYGTGSGDSYVYEYEPESGALQPVVDVSKVLGVPEGHYTPGKIHSRLDMGRDGCLYFSTMPGIIPAANKSFHYQGDSIFRYDPSSGKTVVIADVPVPNHGLPTSILDPDNLIYYAGAWMIGERGIDRETGKTTKFIAYDLKNRKMLYEGNYGPDRYIFFARSTHRAYYVAGRGNFMTGPLWRFDPNVGFPEKLGVSLGLRAATEETPQGIVYTFSNGQLSSDPQLWAFDTKRESVERLGSFAVGNVTYVASAVADSTGRYLYYLPGAHGDARDGTSIVQYDTQKRSRKIVAFLHPYIWEKYGSAPIGTYSLALGPNDDALYITCNTKRSALAEWDCCALVIVHIPESERQI